MLIKEFNLIKKDVLEGHDTFTGVTMVQFVLIKRDDLRV